MESSALDPLSYVAPTRIRVLVKPWLPLKRDKFEGFLAQLKAACEVHLSDVPAGSTAELGGFNASSFPAGRIIYDFRTHVDKEHDHLESFEYARRIFVILLVADGSEAALNLNVAEEKLKSLQKLAPTAILSRAWVFGGDEKQAGPLLSILPENAHIQQLRGNMSDMTAALLVQFNKLAGELRQRSTITSPFDPASTLLKQPSANLSSSALSDMRISPSTSPGPDRNPRFTLAPSTLTDRAKMQGQSRIAKTTGDLFKLCGFYSEALKWYAESTAIAKANSDHLWHASGLEGIGQCCVLSTYAEVTFAIPSAATNAIYRVMSKDSKDGKDGKDGKEASKPEGEPVAPPQKQDTDLVDFIPDLHTAILNLYQRSTAFPQDTVPPICMAESALRLAKFLASIHLAGSLNKAAMSNIVLGRTIPPSTKGAYPPRGEIAAWAMRAYSGSAESLNLADKCHVLGGLAAVLGSVNFKRRRAFFLREIVLCLTPALVQARVTGAAGLGVHPAAGLAMADNNIASLLSQVGSKISLHALLDDLCCSYGIPKSADLQSIQYNALTGAGWRSLQSAVLKDCTAICEAMPDLKGVQQFTTRILETTATDLGRDDQVKLVSNLPRVAGVARKYGLHDMEVPFWDPYLVRGCKLCPPSVPPPTQQSQSELVQRDPVFLYNPFNKEAPQADAALLVQDELAEFEVTLQNPFQFDIEAITITLVTDGVEFDCIPGTCFIYARTTQTVKLSGTAKSSGQLVIKGCSVKMFGCQESFFQIVSPPSRVELEHWSQSRGGPGRIKTYGLSALHDPSTHSDLLGKSRTLTLAVTPAQPRLSYHKSSLALQDTITLLEGEEARFSITLQNDSETAVNRALLTFMDSTTLALQKAIKDRRKLPHELYELETFLYDRLALSCQSDPLQNIRAGAKRTFDISVTGKRGLASAEVLIDYGHQDDASSATLYTRRLKIPLKVNMSGSVEILRSDILPFEAASLSEQCSAAGSPQVQQLFKAMSESEARLYCLLLLNVRNVHSKGLTLTVSIDIDQPAPYTIVASLDSGQSQCLLFPLKKIFLPDAKTKPIPPRSKRQFVVSSGLSLEQEQLSRQLFWYREALLERLIASWASGQQSIHAEGQVAHVSSELEHSRSGHVELRAISMSQRKMRVIMLPPLYCQITVPNVLPADTVTQATVKVVNQTSACCRLTLRFLSLSATDNLARREALTARPKSMQSGPGDRSDLGSASVGQPQSIFFPGCPSSIIVSGSSEQQFTVEMLALDAAEVLVACVMNIEAITASAEQLQVGQLICSNMSRTKVLVS